MRGLSGDIGWAPRWAEALVILAMIGAAPEGAMALEGSAEAEAKAGIQMMENAELGTSDYGWGQVYMSGQGQVLQGPHLVGALRLGALGQLGAAPQGQGAGGRVRIQGLSLGAVGLLGGHLDVEVGRFSARFGEGFLLADGVPSPRSQGVVGALGPWQAPWDDFTGARVRGESEGLFLEGLITRQEGGVLIAGDGAWQVSMPGAIWGEGGISLVALAREGAPRHMASLRGGLGLGMGELRGELALQAGADRSSEGVETSRLGASGYLKGTWDVFLSPLPAEIMGGVAFYSGDDPETPRNEGWDPIFQADAGTGTFSQGIINPLLSGYNSDQITLSLGSEVEVKPSHSLALAGLLRLSHRGTAQCLELDLGPTCLMDGQDSLQSAGSLTPMLGEINITYSFAQATELGPLRHGARLAIATPMRGGEMTTLPQGGSPQAILGVETSTALQLFSEAHF